MKWLACLLLFLAGTFTGAGFLAAMQAPTPKNEDPPFRNLDANLYIQTAAEYRACCYQAFDWAERTMSVRAVAPQSGKLNAVVLDLDETVIDNGRFQSTMIRKGWAFDGRIWDDWETSHADAVALIPGAKRFLDSCKKQNVATVFISNRSERNRAGTKAALDKLGIAVPDGQLLLATTTSDKSARRARAEEQFNVILFVGDNLRDFDDRFKFDPAKGIDGRIAEVESTRAQFGSKWIILPNPAYGEWTKPFGKGKADAEALVPSVEFKP